MAEAVSAESSPSNGTALSGMLAKSSGCLIEQFLDRSTSGSTREDCMIGWFDASRGVWNCHNFVPPIFTGNLDDSQPCCVSVFSVLFPHLFFSSLTCSR